mgnify:CR=1 FL=1
MEINNDVKQVIYGYADIIDSRRFDELNTISKNNLLSVARELKEKLSSSNDKKNDALATLVLNNEIFELRLSIVELGNLISKLVCKTLKICDQALLDAGLDHSELKEIVLAMY